MTKHHAVMIVGGGTAGITVAARLRIAQPDLDIAIIEPSDKHYYQPIWTLVGGGVFDKSISERDEKDYIPSGVTWIRDRCSAFDPAKNAVELGSGERVTYDYLVVCAGIQLDWKAIDGLEGALGSNGICSNYSFETVESTWRFLQAMQKGNAVFTFPKTPIKCAGAPQKIMYLADDHLRRRGVRDQCKVIYAAGSPAIFGVAHYAEPLNAIVARKGIDTHFKKNLIAVRPGEKKAVFEDLDGGPELVLDYELLHVVPPQSAPDFIKKSPLANTDGWVEVDDFSLQHKRFDNVFSLGDCSSLPASRTGAAIRKQAPVLVDNLLARRRGEPLEARYDGYASCPLVTGYGKLILAEFGYGGKIMETFPFDQRRERYSMYALKAYGLPELYWNGMLRGRL
ncbi:MAG: NAD(P)/FAD-dependent oxidoreductase [Planctomycetes bacterium]|nr:NAD(P)/FAD-dependent oxidoreductase [Planctomycetota bacterium]